MEALCHQAGKHTDMRLGHLDDIGLDYALTLEHWRRRFNGAAEQVQGLGFNDAFRRLWEYYFCYCEGGFRERAISTVQMTFDKPEYSQ